MRLPGKVFSMSCAGQRLVVATSSRHVLIYDIRMYAFISPSPEYAYQPTATPMFLGHLLCFRTCCMQSTGPLSS